MKSMQNVISYLCFTPQISRGENKIENLHSKFTLPNSKKTEKW